MKILAITGSPRKGNTYDTVKKLEKRMKEHDSGIDFQYIFLNEAGLESCRGCFLCFSRGAEHCPIKDGRAELERRIMESDGIIAASPVYAMNVSALMKNFIDRFAYTMHRPQFFRQHLLTVATTGGTGLKQALSALDMLSGGGYNLTGRLGLVTPPWPLSPEYQAKSEKKLQKAADRFYFAVKAGQRPAPAFMSIFVFRLFKGLTHMQRQYLPEDYKYYSQRKSYYYETRLSGLKNAAAGLMVVPIMAVMKKMFRQK